VAKTLNQRLFARCWQQVATVAACCLLITIRAQALDYTPISLECMLATADAIVVAKLPTSTESSDYSVQVTAILHGDDLLPGVLQVKESAPWRGTAPRFTSTEALFFLQHTKAGQWEVSGPSGEGRVPLEEQHVDLTAISLPLPETNNRYSRDLLLDALEMASHCFSFQRHDKTVMPTNHCRITEQEKIMTRSALHRSLFERLNNAAEQGGLNCSLLETGR